MFFSQPRCVSAACAVSHGDVVRLGEDTRLLFHIHDGSDTCDDCEPGQVQAALSKQEPEKGRKLLKKQMKNIIYKQ